MGLQKYRADEQRPADANGAIECYTNWMGGPTLALVRNCPTPFGPRTVYVRGEPDTWFSVPAACKYRGRTITGYLVHSREEDNRDLHEGIVFRAHNGPGTVYPFAE